MSSCERKVNKYTSTPHVSQLMELTPEETSLPRIRRREALAAKCEKSIRVNASDLIDTPLLRIGVRAAFICLWEVAARTYWCYAAVQFSLSNHGTHVVDGKAGGGSRRIPLLLCECKHYRSMGGVNRLLARNERYISPNARRGKPST